MSNEHALTKAYTASHQLLNEALLASDDRTKCEVWTRIMGYHRPKSSANTGKQGEMKERVYFEVSE